MKALIVSASEELPLWDYVSVSDYRVPAAPVVHTVKKRLAVLRKLVQKKNMTSESPLKPEAELSALACAHLGQMMRALPQTQAKKLLVLASKLCGSGCGKTPAL